VCGKDNGRARRASGPRTDNISGLIPTRVLHSGGTQQFLEQRYTRMLAERRRRNFTQPHLIVERCRFARSNPVERHAHATIRLGWTLVL
jgi:hypothetical protein